MPHIADTTHPGMVALKVADLPKLTQFYQEIIGLTLLKKAEKEAILGVGKQPLLRLKKVDHPLPVTRKTGLYHVAFLLPSRADLGDAMIHYLAVDAPLDGASDHGYSEALYLTDPEGNGIEVYHDKPVSDWDIRDNGEIVGVTMEMDAQGVANAATGTWHGFPKGTTVGHVHLKVADLKATKDFYTHVLGLSLKSNFGAHAKFFAAGNYHHHIGSNVWSGRHLPAMAENDLGLDYFSFLVENQKVLEQLEEHWTTLGLDYEKDASGSLSIIDPNGIQVKIEVEIK